MSASARSACRAVVWRSCSWILCTRPVEGQSAATSTAAVPSEKGGQDVFGAYDVAQWPKPLTVDARGTRTGRGAPDSTSSPRARTASSSCSAASCPSSSGRSRPIRLPQIGPSIEFPMFRLPLRDATTREPSGSALRTRRQDAGRRSRCRHARRRLSLGAHRHRLRRAGQPDRGLDAVGQDVPAAARGLHQPVRSGEERLDRRRLPARDLQVLATTGRSCCRRSASRTCPAPTTSTSTGRRSWPGCPTARSSLPTATRTRAS